MSIIEDLSTVDVQQLRAEKWWPYVGEQTNRVAEMVRQIDLMIQPRAHGAFINAIWEAHLARRNIDEGLRCRR